MTCSVSFSELRTPTYSHQGSCEHVRYFAERVLNASSVRNEQYVPNICSNPDSHVYSWYSLKAKIHYTVTQ